MKLVIAAVGSPARPLAGAIEEYEERARRYWPLEIVEVKAEGAGKGKTKRRVRALESERLIGCVPDDMDTVALTRPGTGMDSIDLAKYLQKLALYGHAGAAFIIGGALGLSSRLVEDADRTLSLSRLTMPHDLARLVLLEQLYRAGTIVRGEPYHK